MTREAISAENWTHPPHSRRSFQNVQALFPTIRIRRGAGPPAAFDLDLRDLGGISYAGLDGAPRSIRQMLDASYTDAFLVSKDGVVVCERYFNGMAADSHHLLNSVTKSFIGVLVGIAAHRGALDVDQRVAEFVPEFAGTALDQTSIRTALDMSAAVAFDEDYANPQADFWRETSVVGWRPALLEPGAPDTLFDFATSLRATDQGEGEKYHYRTVLTNVLGMVLERATGKELPPLFESELWSKLGPEQDACIVADRIGFPYVGAGMNACARDLARFGEMIVREGHYNGQQIVPREWIADTRYADAHAKKIFSESEYGETMPGAHYRNQFWVLDSERGVLLAIGIYGQTIHMNMSTGTVIVKLSSQPEPVGLEIFLDTFAAMDALSEAV